MSASRADPGASPSATASDTDAGASPTTAAASDTDPGASPTTAAATYTAAEVDAAVGALGEPERLAHAQDVVTHALPALQGLLAQALHEGGWFAGAHAAEIQRIAAEADPEERLRALDLLVAEETRLGMFVGVAVGLQLAQELRRVRQGSSADPPEDPVPTST